MHVISRQKFRSIWASYPELEKALRAWLKTTEKVHWGRFSDVRATFPDVDQVGKFLVFNILGNRFRLICTVSFEKGKVYLREFLTHAEYERNRWKGD
ncbi:MAG: type II toxin-antitoxin system HigB family toxin [Isosphaeraceae bacterium]